MMWQLRVALVSAVALGAAGTAWWSYTSGHRAGVLVTQAKWDSERAMVAQAAAAHAAEARATEQRLQRLVDAARKEKQDETRRLTSNYQSLLARVRERPTNGTCVVPEASPDRPAACTGAELSAGSAEAVVRIAQRADEIRLFAAQCWSAYKAAAQ